MTVPPGHTRSVVQRAVLRLLVGLLASGFAVFGVGQKCHPECLTLTSYPPDLVSLQDTVTISWAEGIWATFRYARVPGGGLPQNYPLTISQTISQGPGLIQFVPEGQLHPGVYYCLVTHGSRSSPEFVLAISSQLRHPDCAWETLATDAHGFGARGNIARFSCSPEMATMVAKVQEDNGTPEDLLNLTPADLDGSSESAKNRYLLAGTVINPAGQAICRAEVRASNGRKELRDQTDALGQYAFSIEPGLWELTVGKKEYVSPQPEAVTVTDASAGKNLVLTPRASLVSGRVTEGQGESPGGTLRTVLLAGVLITLEDSLGNVICDTTNSSGVYLISASPGPYLFRAEKDGYEPSTPEEIAVPSGSIILPDLALNPEAGTASLWGTVTLGPEPLDMITVTVWSLTQGITDTTWTEEDGSYLFDELPAPDRYVVEISEDGFEPLSSGPIWLTSPGNRWDFHFPVGQIRWLITEEGQIPLPGVQVHLRGAGVDTTLHTDSMGVCETPAYLEAGDFVVTMATDEQHIPAAPYRLSLGQDESRMELVHLPIRHTPWPEDRILSVGEEVPICTRVFSPEESTRVYLYWRGAGNTDFLRAEMVSETETSHPGKMKGLAEWTQAKTQANPSSVLYWATIPAQSQPGFLEYFIEVWHEGHLYSRRSNPWQVAVSNRGVLYRAQVFSEQKRLQTGHPCVFRVQVYDDEGSDLSSQLTARDVVWSVLEGPGQIRRSPEDPTRAIYVTQKPGLVRIGAVVTLNGVSVRAKTLVAHPAAVLGQLEIIGPALPVISNQSQATFQYVAQDTFGQEMSIEPRWDFQPETAGDMFPAREGDEVSFVPDEDFIGQVRIFLTDSISGQTVEYNTWYGMAECDRGLSVYHTLVGGAPEVVLRDDGDFRLVIPDSALPPGDTTQISLRKPFASDVKRYTPGHEIHGEIYDLRSSSSTHFLRPLRIVLPIVPEARSLSAVIGRWDLEELGWVELGGSRRGDEISTEVDHFSQFAVLSLSEPLAIDEIHLLPNPFTPHDPYGLQLGFTLSTDQARKPFVTIKVYNMVGDLVRTICENEPMPKGSYAPGESFLDSKGRDITRWDGRTDTGELARNGRYLIHFKVDDSGGTVQALKTVVLIK